MSIDPKEALATAISSLKALGVEKPTFSQVFKVARSYGAEFSDAWAREEILLSRKKTFPARDPNVSPTVTIRAIPEALTLSLIPTGDEEPAPLASRGCLGPPPKGTPPKPAPQNVSIFPKASPQEMLARDILAELWKYVQPVLGGRATFSHWRKKNKHAALGMAEAKITVEEAVAAWKARAERTGEPVHMVQYVHDEIMLQAVKAHKKPRRVAGGPPVATDEFLQGMR